MVMMWMLHGLILNIHADGGSVSPDVSRDGLCVRPLSEGFGLCVVAHFFISFEFLSLPDELPIFDFPLRVFVHFELFFGEKGD